MKITTTPDYKDEKTQVIFAVFANDVHCIS